MTKLPIIWAAVAAPIMACMISAPSAEILRQSDFTNLQKYHDKCFTGSSQDCDNRYNLIQALNKKGICWSGLEGQGITERTAWTECASQKPVVIDAKDKEGTISSWKSYSGACQKGLANEKGATFICEESHRLKQALLSNGLCLNAAPGWILSWGKCKSDSIEKPIAYFEKKVLPLDLNANTEKLIKDWSRENDSCRGSGAHQVDDDNKNPCSRREKISEVLEKRGWCMGEYSDLKRRERWYNTCKMDGKERLAVAPFSNNDIDKSAQNINTDKRPFHINKDSETQRSCSIERSTIRSDGLHSATVYCEAINFKDRKANIDYRMERLVRCSEPVPYVERIKHSIFGPEKGTRKISLEGPKGSDPTALYDEIDDYNLWFALCRNERQKFNEASLKEAREKALSLLDASFTIDGRWAANRAECRSRDSDTEVRISGTTFNEYENYCKIRSRSNNKNIITLNLACEYGGGKSNVTYRLRFESENILWINDHKKQKCL